MRRQLELEMGRRPSTRLIWQLWTRRGGVDARDGAREILGCSVYSVLEFDL